MKSRYEEDARHSVFDAVRIVDVGGRGNVKETSGLRVTLALFALQIATWIGGSANLRPKKAKSFELAHLRILLYCCLPTPYSCLLVGLEGLYDGVTRMAYKDTRLLRFSVRYLLVSRPRVPSSPVRNY